MNNWPTSPLTDADHKAISSLSWKVFPKETVALIAGAWNAGMTTADMAIDLNCRPGSLRILIGRLTQAGVRLRKARIAGFRRITPAPLSTAKPLDLAHLARLRRLAMFDIAARRALEAYEQGVFA